MKLNELMLDAGSDIFYDDKFRSTLELFMTHFRNSSGTTVKMVPAIDAYRYEFDLFSLLSSYNIPPYLHWIIMRMNKMTSPTELSKDVSALLIPNASIVEQIRQAFMSTQRLN